MFGSTGNTGMFGAAKPATPGFGGFGAPTTSAPGFNFGTTPSMTSAGTGFGMGTPQANTGLSFGAAPGFGTPAAAPTGFGTTAAAPTGFGATAGATTGFGTPAAAPTGFGATAAAPAGFGATAPAPTGFGAAVAPTFGAPTSTPSVGFGTFGSAPATGFGITPASSASTGFGTTPTATGFGATSTTPLQFGQPATTQTGFQLGAPSQPLSGLSFGTPASSAATSLTGGSVTFGTPTTTATSLFGTTTPAFGAPATTTAAGLNFNFGATTSTTASTGFSLGAPAPTSSTGLNFGAPKTTGALSFGLTPSTSLSFGATTTSAPTLGFGLSTTTSSSGLSLGVTGFLGASSAGLTTVTSTTTVGLGGVDSAQGKLGLSGSGITEPKHVKDQPLPDPILQNFNDFQAFVKQQKSLSMDIAHSSAKPLKKVQEDIDNIDSLLANITSGLARNTVATEKLKNETAQGLFHADMAQRLRESPSSLLYEYGPEQYFAELVSRFETDGTRLQVQVEAAERHLRSITQSSAISPQELTLAMRRLHESMVVLAARAQSLHLSTQAALEEYRHLRHVYLKEDTPVAPKPMVTTRRPAQRSLAGPTPFSETSGVANLTVDALSMLTGATMPLVPPAANAGWLGSQTPGTAQMTSPNSSFLSSHPVENSAFQLSKPPVGNKRNKR